MENWTVMQCCSEGATERLFKRGVEACWVEAPCTAVLPAKGKIESKVCSHWIQLGREIRTLHSKRTSVHQPSMASKLGVMENWEIKDRDYCEGSGLGIRLTRVEHLRLFKTRQNPLPQQSSNLWEEKMYPAPTSYSIARTLSNGEALQNRQNNLKNPLQNVYPQEKGRKRNSKRAHFVPLSERQNTVVSGALFHWNQQGRATRDQYSKG